MNKKNFDKTLNDVIAHNEYDGFGITATECAKHGLWSPCDLIIREYLNNGGGSAQGFLGISPQRCINAFNHICEHKQEFIDKDLVSEDGFNNFGFTLWSNYGFDFCYPAH